MVNEKEFLVKTIKEMAEQLGRAPYQDEITSKRGINEWKIRKWGGYLRLLDLANLAAPPKLDRVSTLKQKIQQLHEANSLLKAEVDDLKSVAVNDEKIRALIGLCNSYDFAERTEWMRPAKKYKGVHGIPNLMISDVHFDERVDASQIQYSNEYNREIATRRLKTTFQSTVDILKGCFANPQYEGFCLHLGGDLLSGNIHEELKETNEDSIARSVLMLTDLLIEFIGYVADEFGFVFVTGVVGNHSRFDKKPRAKNRVYDNYEWLIYQYLMRHFADDTRVTFLIPDGPDAQFEIYNVKFLSTHGDQFRGGSGISGLLAPLMLGLHRKQKRQAQIQKPFDVMLMGHFHSYYHTDSFVINGSVKGYDEFAHLSNFSFERPQQAMFIVHPENGITFRCPVFCDKQKTKRPEAKIIY